MQHDTLDKRKAENALKAQILREEQRPYAELTNALDLTEPSLRFAAFKIRGRKELTHSKTAFGL